MRSNVIASAYSRGIRFERAALGLRLSRRGFVILEVDGVLNNGDRLATRKSGKKTKRDKKISPRSKRISTTRATWLTGTGKKIKGERTRSVKRSRMAGMHKPGLGCGGPPTRERVRELTGIVMKRIDEDREEEDQK